MWTNGTSGPKPAPGRARAGARILAAGGGAFLLHYDGTTGALAAYDGRETAPAAAAPEPFAKPDGSLPGHVEALTGGRAVGTPGLLRMLEAAGRHRLPYADLPTRGPPGNLARSMIMIQNHPYGENWRSIMR